MVRIELQVIHKPAATLPSNIPGIATGTMYCVLNYSWISFPGFSTSLPYFIITLSLNILLTIMIIARLASRSRNIQNAMGVSTGTSKLFKVIASIFAESCLLFLINSLLFLPSSIIGGGLAFISFPALAQSQVSIVYAFPQCTTTFECSFLIVSQRTGHSSVPPHSTNRK